MKPVYETNSTNQPTGTMYDLDDQELNTSGL